MHSLPRIRAPLRHSAAAAVAAALATAANANENDWSVGIAVITNVPL